VLIRHRIAIFTALTLSTAVAQTIVQPGAPGTNSKVLTPSSLRIVERPPLPPDTEFMQGMIHHHQQAVEMVALMKARTTYKPLLKLGERISISQTDEIQFMRNWLIAHGKAVPMDHDHMHMDHAAGSQMPGQTMDMSTMAPMPGMLTAEQMKALTAAKGSHFDYLFLTGMIQHHTGALTMVDELFSSPATAQESQLFDFVTDVDNTQSAEIKIMQGMLKGKK
jgi:uncharacterized protein (DUF305 family)